MTAAKGFERELDAWLREDAAHRVPDHLSEVLERTVATRQRPRWSSVGWVLRLDIASSRRVPVGSRQLRLVLVGAVLILAVVALAILAGGARRPLPPPFGLARDGIVVAGVSGDLFRIDPASGTRTPLLSDAPDAFDFSPTFSRDGTKLVYLRSVLGKGLELVVANPDGSDATVIGPAVDGLDQYDWSADGSRIAFLSRDLGRGRINVANSDGTGVTRTLALPFPVNQISWLPPDGDMILFRREHLLDKDPPPGIFAIRPDGASAAIAFSTRPAVDNDDYQDVSASPDGVSIAYRESGLVGRSQAHILDRATGVDRVLPAPADSLGQTSPAFSPDGVHVMYLRIKAGNASELVIAPLDGTSTGIELPLAALLRSTAATDQGWALNNTFFAPDGLAVIGNDQTTNTEWLLPIDGSPGTILAHGSQETDGLSTVQRLAP
jgi:Tol biopolymer transport system component